MENCFCKGRRTLIAKNEKLLRCKGWTIIAKDDEWLLQTTKNCYRGCRTAKNNELLLQRCDELSLRRMTNCCCKGVTNSYCEEWRTAVSKVRRTLIAKNDELLLQRCDELLLRKITNCCCKGATNSFCEEWRTAVAKNEVFLQRMSNCYCEGDELFLQMMSTTSWLEMFFVRSTTEYFTKAQIWWRTNCLKRLPSFHSETYISRQLCYRKAKKKNRQRNKWRVERELIKTAVKRRPAIPSRFRALLDAHTRTPNKTRSPLRASNTTASMRWSPL